MGGAGLEGEKIGIGRENLIVLKVKKNSLVTLIMDATDYKHFCRQIALIHSADIYKLVRGLVCLVFERSCYRETAMHFFLFLGQICTRKTKFLIACKSTKNNQLQLPIQP